MSSHIHLGLLSGHMALKSWLHPLHTAIAAWVSTRRRVDEPKTLGQVFGDRPATNLLPVSAAFPLIAYHHNNPRKAGMVKRVADSLRTSHRQYLGLSGGTHVRALDVSRGLTLCGMDRAAFARKVEAACDDLSWVEGGLRLVIRMVSERFAVHEDELCGGSRTSRVVFARRVAANAAQQLGYSPAKIATALRVSRQAVRKTLQTSSREAQQLGRELADQLKIAS